MDKIILTTSARDSHGVQINKDLLAKAVEAVNGHYKMRYLVNHKREYPPYGYLDNAELAEQDSVDIVIVEPFLYAKSEEVEWDKKLLIKKLPHPINFKRRNKNSEGLGITLDPNNFKTFDNFLEVEKRLKLLSTEPLEIITDTRKAHQLDNRIILTLATYYTVIHPFVTPFLKK